MSRRATSRYSIEIKNVATGALVVFTMADWTEEEKRVAVGQLLRLAGLPDDGNSFESRAEPQQVGGKTAKSG